MLADKDMDIGQCISGILNPQNILRVSLCQHQSGYNGNLGFLYIFFFHQSDDRI